MCIRDRVKDGRIIGEGWHTAYGKLHAEREALAHCTEDPCGATIYVTLEPCCHWGKTPPCTDCLLYTSLELGGRGNLKLQLRIVGR